jgi:hypothetical protein
MPTNFSFLSIITTLRSAPHQNSSGSILTIQFSQEEIHKTFPDGTGFGGAAGVATVNSLSSSSSSSSSSSDYFQQQLSFRRGRYVLIKCLTADTRCLLDLDNQHKDYEMLFKSHCDLLSRLNHPNILKFFGFSLAKNPLDSALVFEYLSGGTLYQRSSRNSKKKKKRGLVSILNHHRSPVSLRTLLHEASPV